MVGDTSLLLRVAAPRASATAETAAAADLPSGRVLLGVPSDRARLRWYLRCLNIWFMLVYTNARRAVDAARVRCPDRSSATPRRSPRASRRPACCQECRGVWICPEIEAGPALPRFACTALPPSRARSPQRRAATRPAGAQLEADVAHGVLARWPTLLATLPSRRRGQKARGSPLRSASRPY